MTEPIAAIPAHACILCGREGKIVYRALEDRLFGAPGAWDLKRCPDTDCGLVWLDPMPAEDEIWKAYTTYFTHKDYAGPGISGVALPNRALMKIGKPLLKLLSHATGLRSLEREHRRKAEGMFLGDPVPGGRLLEVGCGNGDALSRMCRRGWAGEGVDTDPKGVEHARERHGLTVHLGRLENLHFPGDSFDAVTMQHVIEHVHDPVSLLRECFRLLKPGGRIVLLTPNPGGLGHRWFREHWRGLDPPRHLHIFTAKALSACAASAGFRRLEIFTTPRDAEGTIRDSLMIRDSVPGRKRGAFHNLLIQSYLTYYEVFRSRTDAEAGEEIVLIGRKSD